MSTIDKLLLLSLTTLMTIPTVVSLTTDWQPTIQIQQIK